MNYEIIHDELLVSVNSSLYSEEVLFKCFYWYGNHYAVDISRINDDFFQIRIKPHADINPVIMDWESVVTKIKQDLIDFKVRDIVTKETKTIRELIVAKAFAYYDSQTNPTSEISDPVGFVPK